MAILDDLKWRYTTKKMNGQRVSEDKLDYILEAARFAPTSSNLQPFKIFLVSEKELLEQIKEAAFPFNQSLITNCSHLLIWAAWDGYSVDRLREVILRNFRERDLPDERAEEYLKGIWGLYGSLGQDWHQHHSAKQAYLSFGLAVAAAAEQKVDATPMEGFNQAVLDEILQLNKWGLKSVLLLPIGYRDEANDWNVNLKKWRVPKNELVTELKVQSGQ